jgi:hypothetical protein
MLEGKCPNCGACYYGWALKNPLHKTCLNCGAALEIGESNGYVPTDDLPSSANLRQIKPPPGPNDREDDTHDW